MKLFAIDKRCIWALNLYIPLFCFHCFDVDFVVVPWDSSLDLFQHFQLLEVFFMNFLRTSVPMKKGMVNHLLAYFFPRIIASHLRCNLISLLSFLNFVFTVFYSINALIFLSSLHTFTTTLSLFVESFMVTSSCKCLLLVLGDNG